MDKEAKYIARILFKNKIYENDLATKHKEIVFNPFLTKDLEDLFLNLGEEDIYDIIGCIPSPEKVETVDFSILTEVVNFLMEKQKPYRATEKLIPPDFDEKIRFNGLSRAVESFLRVGNYQVGALEEYFKLSSNYAKKDLRDILKAYYDEGVKP